MARFTVFGASGFIGSHVVRYLTEHGEDVRTPDVRERVPTIDNGHIICCIGLTGDFRERPFDAMHAHVNVLMHLLDSCEFLSFLSLSSARVYNGAEVGAEDAKLRVDPTARGDLYNLSKLAGEALCFAHPNPTVRVARLSNVFSDTIDPSRPARDFLPSLVRAAVHDGHIKLESAPDSAKDYVWMGDVNRALHRIALSGKHRIYNVASGRNVSHGEIVGELQRLTGCGVDVVPGAPRQVYPTIDLSRLGSEFPPPDRPWAPANLMDHLEKLIASVSDKARTPVGAEP